MSMAKEDYIFRGAPPHGAQAANLGLIADFPGVWKGKGFNLIARPARQGVATNPPFLLELNGTTETLKFTAIGGDIPNRGTIEPTRLLHGVTYLQQVTDCADNNGIHIEPGLWVHVPPTAENTADTYVRHATIPHGDALLAQSTFAKLIPGGPDIQPVNSFPFAQSDPIPPINGSPANPKGSPYIDPYLKDPLPGECLPHGLVPATTIKDPTEVLRAANKGLNFKETVVLVISTTPPPPPADPVGGILNIPFVVKNANAVQMDAIFWIETVKHPSGKEYLQLQYVQRVILDFLGIHWPHFSVATLIKE